MQLNKTVHNHHHNHQHDHWPAWQQGRLQPPTACHRHLHNAAFLAEMGVKVRLLFLLFMKTNVFLQSIISSWIDTDVWAKQVHCIV